MENKAPSGQRPISFIMRVRTPSLKPHPPGIKKTRYPNAEEKLKAPPIVNLSIQLIGQTEVNNHPTACPISVQVNK
jgi:hypothetical protein